MEKLNLVAEDAGRALTTLKEITEEPYSVIIRDAAIQRFEYSYEVFWKLIKEYLKEREGIICAYELMDKVYKKKLENIDGI